MIGRILADQSGHHVAVFLQNHILSDDGCHYYLCCEILVAFEAHPIGFLPAKLPFVVSSGELSHVAQEIWVFHLIGVVGVTLKCLEGECEAGAFGILSQVYCLSHGAIQGEDQPILRRAQPELLFGGGIPVFEGGKDPSLFGHHQILAGGANDLNLHAHIVVVLLPQAVEVLPIKLPFVGSNAGFVNMVADVVV